MTILRNVAVVLADGDDRERTPTGPRPQKADPDGGNPTRDVRPVSAWLAHVDTVPMGTATRQVAVKVAELLDHGSGRGRFSVSTSFGLSRPVASRHINFLIRQGLIRCVRRHMNATAVWQTTVPADVPVRWGEWDVSYRHDPRDGYRFPAGWSDPREGDPYRHPITGELLHGDSPTDADGWWWPEPDPIDVPPMAELPTHPRWAGMPGKPWLQDRKLRLGHQ
ncbi:hypothetical protein ACG83_34900 [Frankia sp. R43]|nr:hypothetical protein ACG83_34900 [Frankia sp. R43]